LGRNRSAQKRHLKKSWQSWQSGGIESTQKAAAHACSGAIPRLKQNVTLAAPIVFV